MKRFCEFFGITLDYWDEVLDTFYQKINAGTAPNPFVIWWLWSLFGWSWFPKWYSLARKRQLYADFTTHLARRGTRRGIEEFLRAFSIHARVFNKPLYWGEFVWGEDAWGITGGPGFYGPQPEITYGPTFQVIEPADALGIVVQVSHLADEVNSDVQGMSWGEMVWGEGYFRDTEATLTKREIEDLIRFEWPNGQQVMIQYKVRRNVAGPEAWEDTIPWNENEVPLENSGPMT